MSLNPDEKAVEETTNIPATDITPVVEQPVSTADVVNTPVVNPQALPVGSVNVSTDVLKKLDEANSYTHTITLNKEGEHTQIAPGTINNTNNLNDKLGETYYESDLGFLLDSINDVDLKKITKTLVELNKVEIEALIKFISLVARYQLHIPSNKVLEFPFSEECSARVNLTDTGMQIGFFVNGIQQMDMGLENEVFLFKAALKKMGCEDGFKSHSKLIFAEQKLRAQIIDIIGYDGFVEIVHILEGISCLKRFK